jgi:hypothetical protein
MRTLAIGWEAARQLARLIWESAWYALLFLVSLLSSRGKLAAEIVALRSQVAACRDRVERKQAPKPLSTAQGRQWQHVGAGQVGGE